MLPGNFGSRTLSSRCAKLRECYVDLEIGSGFMTGQGKVALMKTKLWFKIHLCMGLALLATPATAQKTPHVTPNTRATSTAPKATKSALKLAFPAVGLVPEDISPETADVVWFYHKGFRNDELLDYVNRSHADFHLSVADVNYLKDVGISTEVVVAMIRPADRREQLASLRDRQPQYPTPRHVGHWHREGPNNVAEIEPARPTLPSDYESEQLTPPNLNGPVQPANPMPRRFPAPYGNRFDNRFYDPSGGYNGNFQNRFNNLRP
jgi:hypothetical protein